VIPKDVLVVAKLIDETLSTIRWRYFKRHQFFSIDFI